MPRPSKKRPSAKERCLLAWYGITDLRAALGLDENGGPVLGALRTGDFSSVVLVAYCDKTKSGVITEALQKDWERRQPGVGSAVRDGELRAVDAFSNTTAGHRLFRDWLESRLQELGVAVQIKMLEVELAHLNDAIGIFGAATEALDTALSTHKDCELVVHLSPGTPVMAFTWAFVALTNPDLAIQAIASSDFRKPPEVVEIPPALLASTMCRKRPVHVERGNGFDVVYHLMGAQRLPVLIGVLQFHCMHHVFVTNKGYKPEAMKRFLPAGAKYEALMVDPFDPRDTEEQVLKSIGRLPVGSRVAMNLTGGTKLMFSGANSACTRVGATPFYFETSRQELIYLDDYRRSKAAGVASVEQFCELNGFEATKLGHWADDPSRQRRAGLTRFLWTKRRDIGRLYLDLADHIRSDYGGGSPFSFSKGKVCASMDERGVGRLRIGDARFEIDASSDFARYLCGGWLEEFAHLELAQLRVTGRIKDIRIGLELAWPSEVGGKGTTAQEFDVSLTDGKRLLVVECKAGSVKSEDVYKLQDCVRTFGGVEARGVLTTARKPEEYVLKRVQTAGNLRWAMGDGLLKVVSDMLFG